jgi:hypothetical protein
MTRNHAFTLVALFVGALNVDVGLSYGSDLNMAAGAAVLAAVAVLWLFRR